MKKCKNCSEESDVLSEEELCEDCADEAALAAEKLSQGDDE